MFRHFVHPDILVIRHEEGAQSDKSAAVRDIRYQFLDHINKIIVPFFFVEGPVATLFVSRLLFLLKTAPYSDSPLPCHCTSSGLQMKRYQYIRIKADTVDLPVGKLCEFTGFPVQPCIPDIKLCSF